METKLHILLPFGVQSLSTATAPITKVLSTPKVEGTLELGEAARTQLPSIRSIMDTNGYALSRAPRPVSAAHLIVIPRSKAAVRSSHSSRTRHHWTTWAVSTATGVSSTGSSGAISTSERSISSSARVRGFRCLTPSGRVMPRTGFHGTDAHTQG